MENGRSQFVIWFLIIVILIMGFMLAWQKVDEEASDTGLLVASKRIVERASYYKQEWLLNQQPPKLLIDGTTLTMSKAGWVMPIDQNQQASCSFWLQVLYPDNRDLELAQDRLESDDDNLKYQCRYIYSSNQVIVIQIVNDRFTVSVDILTKA
ncbi:MSHA biogenesis protein MshF [Vibrio lamellibrachiae]|uniref:MSHA biogenesis protein MshF n=1 Tax=Vibrio lamellibrachiae TaxID=2910253 RepID=UPI003D0BE2C4